MKRKPSMRTKHNRKIKANKRNTDLYFIGEPNTVTLNVDTGLTAGDYITITNDSESDSAWGYIGSGAITIGGGAPKSPKNVHPARRRKQAKKFKSWNTRIEQTSDEFIIGGGSSVACTKIDDFTWQVIGDVTI